MQARALAGAVRNLAAPDAAGAKEEAVRRAERAADELARADGGRSPLAAASAWRGGAGGAGAWQMSWQTGRRCSSLPWRLPQPG